MSAVASGHRIELFLDFEFAVNHDALDRLTSLQLKHVSRLEWVHPSRLAGDKPVMDKPIWELQEWHVSRDLHAFVRVILDSRPSRSSEHPHCLRLTQYARNLVTGTYRETLSTGGADAAQSSPGRSRRGVALVLPGDPRAVELHIEHVTLHLFRTGVAIAVVTLTLPAHQAEPPNEGVAAELLIEVLPRLCGVGGQHALRWLSPGPTADTKGFGLGDLLTPLVSGAGLSATARHRIYSLCALTFSAPLTDAQRVDTSLRLSRQYHSSFRTATETPGTTFLRPFANVLHAVSREGTCSIIDNSLNPDGRRNDVLADWLHNSHHRVYLPLHLVALHQYIVLLRLGHGAGRHVEFETASDRELGELTALCNQIRFFRLAYRLVQVSTITMHDLVYSAVEKSLGISELSEKIARDLMAVEPRLLELSAQRVERRYRWLTRVLAGGFAYLTLSGVGTHIATAISEKANAVPIWATLAIQSVSIIMAAVAFIIVGSRAQSVKPSVEDTIGAAVD
ncbi:MAG: hypothetical protein QOJ39_3884 [Candidatus Eremiobacteraeota bacterium]|jgi:hypothetical protein|nr:hypothetical protein [Candidatus Eremiobacteraeota bacterium]